MEPVDAAKAASKNNSVSMMISNPKVFDCCICFQLLSIPIFQCDNGHVVCSACCSKLGSKCDKCSKCISLKRCRAFENLLQHIKMPCPNEKYGCRETIDYTQKRKHEEECIYVPCYCPIFGCDFVASSEVLSDHFSHKHEDSQVKFSYGHSFIVSLKSDNEAIVLKEEYNGKVFILNNSTMLWGNAVNICCFGPNASESEYRYGIMGRSQRCKLKLHSIVTNVQQVSLATLSPEFLMIPNGSSKPLKLEICITCNPMIQIFVKDMNGGGFFTLKVKSLDTIFSVKEQIHDKKTCPVQDQRLFFNGRRLHDSLTVADYNIQEASTLHLLGN